MARVTSLREPAGRGRRPTLMRLGLLPLLVAIVGLVACGSDDPATSDAPDVPDTSGESLPPVTEPPATEPPVTEAPGSDQEAGVVLEFGQYGGFTTAAYAFQRPPEILVTTDGRVIGPAPVAAIYPGPLVLPYQVRSISPEGVEALIDAAREADLLREVEYEADEMIADAPTATLTITADGETWVHEAYALGIGPGEEPDADREALASFVERLRDLESLVGADEVGPWELGEPDTYLVRATVVDDLSGFGDGEIEPRLVDWPGDAGIALAEVGECAELDAVDVGELFESADELTFFVDGGTTYEVVVAPKLPGRSC